MVTAKYMYPYDINWLLSTWAISRDVFLYNDIQQVSFIACQPCYYI